MPKKVYIGTSVGIKPNTENGYINTGYILDPTKNVKIELVCYFSDATTYTTVMR